MALTVGAETLMTEGEYTLNSNYKTDIIFVAFSSVSLPKVRPRW